MINHQLVEKIWFFSPLDKLLQEKKSQRDTFILLFERKELLLGLVKDYKIDAKKYKKLVLVSCKDTNELIKGCGAEDISKMKNVKDPAMIEQWFKEMIENTGANYEEQLSQYQKFNQQKQQSKLKGTTVKQVQESLLKMAKSKIQKSSILEASKPTIDYKQIVSFKAADNALEENEDNYEVYQNLFDRKAKIFSLMQKKELTPLKYKAYLENFLSKIKNEDILFQTKLEYESLKDFHDGDVTSWFQEIYEEAKLKIEEQKRKLATLRHLTKMKKPEDSSKTIKSSVNEVKKTQLNIPKYQTTKKSGLNLKAIYSFKAIEDLLQKSKQSAQFLQMMQDRKKFLTHEYQTGVLTAQKYKTLIQNNLKLQGMSQGVKESINYELGLLTDIHQGNVQQWFRDIAEVPIDLPQQKPKKQMQNQLQRPTGDRMLGVQTSKVKVKERQPTSRVNIEVSNVSSVEPDANDIKEISSLKVLDMMLNLNKTNHELYATLFERKQQILSQLKSGNITAQAYQRMQQQEAERAKTGPIKNVVALDLSKIKMNYNSNVKQWLQAIINQSGQTYEMQKEYYQRLKSQNNRQSTQKKEILGFVTQSIKTKQLQASTQRIRTFFRAMAVYESLLYYHKKNKIPYKDHKYLTQYEKTKKEAYRFVEQIEENRSLDVQNLVDELFPPINQHIFYAGEFQTYKAKVQSIKTHLKKEIAAINEYASFLKKSSNPQNLQTAKKEIQECEKNILFLNAWPEGKYQAFPEVKYQQVKKINVDVNKLQANQIQITITNIEGLGSEHILFIYLFDFNKTSHQFLVNDGQIGNISFKEKMSDNQMNSVMKASQAFICFKIYKKSFFGGFNLVAQQNVGPRFTRVNTVQQKTRLQNIQITYIAKVQKPKSPIQKEIKQCRLTKFPVYEHSSFVQDQLIKKFLPYINPSASEIEG